MNLLLVLSSSLALNLATTGAPDSQGSIKGVVRHSEIGMLPGATVTAVQLGVQASPLGATSSADGTFTFSHIPAGVYRVTVVLQGFLTQAQEPVRVWPKASSSVLFVLSLPTPQPVVIGGDPIFDTIRSESSNHELPILPRGRSMADILRLGMVR